MQSERLIDIGFMMNIREWPADPSKSAQPPYVLVHGLASNAQTWDQVAQLLSAAGHPVVAIDQRGHGKSEKPDGGYDFATITGDLNRLIEKLGWERPILAGQSWGGNVLLEFTARYPGVARHLIFVDGGFLNLQERGPWDVVSRELRPPDLIGTPRAQIAARIQEANPGWSAAGVEGTLNNFETMPDGTVRPRLTLEHHMQILKALYDQSTEALFPQVQEPVLICAADDGSEWAAHKRRQVQAAVQGLKEVEVAWFTGAAHDIHVDRPAEFVARLRAFWDKQR